MGVWLFGKPRGETKKFKKPTQFRTYGAGGIWARVRDRKGDCRVRIYLGDITGLTIAEW